MNDNCPWMVEYIPEDSILLRRIPAFQRITERKHKFPGPDHFALRPDLGETYLSFNWSKYAGERESFATIGLTYDKDNKFIDYTSYVFFSYPVKILHALPRYEKVEHIPIWHGNPSEVGNPNNKAHSGLFCGDFDIGTRSTLSIYCQKNEESYLKFNLKTVRDEINALRERNNDTPYHKDWNFES